jgi:Fusaric acid resistance protein-like
VNAPLAWLRRHDPGLVTVRRAARVTLVACLGFYLCRYAIGNATMAPYALFGAVALGALSQIPGSPAQRSRTLLAVLPVGWVLVTIGTLLSVNNWAAAGGMFVLGFLVSFVGVGGPRLVGIAAGTQLLYILPCFPPYDPGSLGWRLAGLTIAVLLLAGAELVLWPDPAPVPYRVRLGDAVGSLAGCLAAVADGWSGDPTGPDRLAALLPEATDAADGLRPSRLPPTQRPASAGREDRALTAAAGTARLVLGRTVDLYFTDDRGAVNLPAAAALLRTTASCAEAAAAWLLGTGPVPDTDQVAAALDEFRIARMNTSPDGVPIDRLRLGALALSLGEWTKSLVTAVRIAAGAPIHPDTTPAAAQPGQFWYAYRKPWFLWWHRLRENLTPRSVYFQGALRLAAALAVARLLAGVLDLSHGFWVLLTILTVLRTSAAETRSALKPALIGTVLGSLVAGALLIVGLDPTLYAVILPFVMIVGFAAGPLLGLGWAQALFTVVITLVFAQVTPVDWRLAEARVLDVVVGAAIGVLIGLFAWPRGGLGELHRATGTFLADAARVVRMTVDVVANGATPGPALPQARQDGQLAEASYALYQSERHQAGTLDWQATLVAGHHAVRGAEALIRSCPSGGVLPGVESLIRGATDVASRYEHVAVALLTRDREALRDPAPEPPGVDWPTNLGHDLYHLADLRVWFDGLREDLGRILGTPEPAPSADPAALRVRVARVADGASG